MATPAEDEELEPWIDARWALILAAAVVLLMRELVPFGRQILYPLTLFGTWVHEMGHGLTGLLVGGSFDRLQIFWNASGLASGIVEPGWPRALRAAGGLLGPPVVGAFILAMARGPKRASIVLWALSALMLISVPLWIRSLTGFVVIPPVALGIALLAYKGGETARHIGAQVLGIVLALDTVTRIDYLFTAEVTVDGRDLPSDVSHIANAVGGHYLLWGGLLAVLSLAFLAVGLRIAWLSPMPVPRLLRRRPKTP